ncbi:MAG: RluA family pseudouridine synthase [Pseudomonadota bacterium]
MDDDEETRLTVSEGGRADSVIAGAVAELSRSRVKALIEGGRVSLNGRVLSEPSRKLAPGDRVTVSVPPPAPAAPAPEAISLHILFEDDAVIVVNKPAGLVVHPAAGHGTGTLVNALLAHCGDTLSGIGGVARPGIVHRLDKDTSGVMVVAKSDAAHRALAAQFADHGRTGPLARRYDALVWGRPEPPAGTIDKPLGRHPADRQRFAVRPEGKTAITHYGVVEHLGDASAVECVLETGRTHQIRVHMAALGHPVVGDPLYGAGFATKANRLSAAAQASISALKRQALHAAYLRFAHPLSGDALEFHAPLPADHADVLAAMREP